jgi:hypothetical protein
MLQTTAGQIKHFYKINLWFTDIYTSTSNFGALLANKLSEPTYVTLPYSLLGNSKH